MAKYFWVTVTHRNGEREKLCVVGRVGKQCFNPTFLFMAPDDPDDALDQLTGQVNAVIESFMADHPDRVLRILADTEKGDREDQLRFAFVGTDLEISLAVPD